MDHLGRIARAKCADNLQPELLGGACGERVDEAAIKAACVFARSTLFKFIFLLCLRHYFFCFTRQELRREYDDDVVGLC